MHAFLTSSIGVTCAAALTLPLTTEPTTATTAPARAAPAQAPTPGSTQSLPLTPSPGDRTATAPGTAPGAAEQRVPRRSTRHFSLVGVVWDDPATALHGRVQVRTRATTTGAWSDWQDLETHNADHAADPGTAEGTSGRVRGATAPLWVGDSDGVEARVHAADEYDVTPLPTGMHLELVDPGEDTETPAPNRTRTENELPALGSPTEQRKAGPHTGPRPRIVTRHGWGADENLRARNATYTRKVKAAFVHHSDTGNDYRCSQAPSVIRGIHRYHVTSMGWRDIGYNFLVDKCGKIYEGRAGGVSKPVLGAHTMGFNANSTGIAVLGTYSAKKPSSAAVKAVARLTAWKLGLHGVNPRGKTYLRSAGGNLYRKGKNVRLNVISGHRDGFATSCPGKQLYGKLRTARSSAAKYQGR
ncbi:N-acetylmuramoyl-L-alanine amidase [Streptomyces sp. NPDC032940]|uniref:peptidoglycan recognition protein family protein n=1 Tax=Streptomyces sp. NPDC032940 TaxID=3155366 RepID=UPI0033C46BD6